MLPLNLKELKPEHIQLLIDSNASENLTLEFKRQLPTGKTEDKKKFLFEVAGLANSAGGDIVIGIMDRKSEGNNLAGVAVGLSGMELPNPQLEIDRLSNLIRDNIAPRVTGIVMEPITLPSGAVLVIRVPRSWNKPHMVTLEGTNKFYGRVGTTKYPMSVEEIGRAFSERGELREQIDRWRSHRVQLAMDRRGPVRLNGLVTLLFHVIPASAFARNVLSESWTLTQQEKSLIYTPHGGQVQRYNADGFLVVAPTGTKFEGYGYTQLFRSGVVEYADSGIYGPTPTGTAVFGQAIERRLVQCYGDAINRFRRQGWTEPLYAGLSLIGVAGMKFYSTMMTSMFSESENTENVFTSPEVFVDIGEPEATPYPKTLLPLVDTVWQIAGYEGTPFKPGGVWNPFGEYQ